VNFHGSRERHSGDTMIREANTSRVHELKRSNFFKGASVAELFVENRFEKKT
jgi:hypothetical protein